MNIEEVIRKYTKEVFTIAGFYVEKLSGIKVVIKFGDEPKAGEFIHNVDKNKKSGDFIKRIEPT